ncbi:RNA polymerase sigma factor [Polaribacter aquimarinus]|uniref:RNA polymerase subunit sigma-70 n=1 Tax=Polaribacter aquimarinus TaxID=2100726 RepID=A0A2U2JBU9_9FLAO|nr:RNA polymerase sigma factor [uncultured Polaribacter sp.]PWG05804.1 RNA polymerase subunit sigma-70 [Polaribacter aquimarinus]
MKLKELIAKCCQQELAAQSELYQLYADVLFTLCLKYSKNYQDAEDTLQDSFITIFDKIKQYKNKGSFEGWLKRITIRTAIQKYRDKAPLQIIKELPFKEEVEELNIENTTLSLDVLLDFIQQLPDRYRLVFNLYVLDSYSHKEIAELLNITQGTSKSNLSRARKILKEKLEIHQKKIKEA